MEGSIISGFKKCGLYPIDPSAVDYTKCIQNQLKPLSVFRNDKEISLHDLQTTEKF